MPAATIAANGPLAVVGEMREVLDPGEHQREKNDDDDGAAVDQHLHQSQELGERQKEDSRDSQQREQQREGRVYDIAGDDHSEGAP